MGPHTCGFPADKEKVHSLEDSCGLHRRGAGGCLVMLFALSFYGGCCLARHAAAQPGVAAGLTRRGGFW